MYVFALKLRLLLATTTLVIFANFHGYICPNKNEVVNIQELLLLLNLTILYAVSYYCSGSVFSLVTNIMISLGLVQFLAIVLYHFLTYTCNYDVVAALHSLWENAMRHYGNYNEPPGDHYLHDDVALLNIDEEDITISYNDED